MTRVGISALLLAALAVLPANPGFCASAVPVRGGGQAAGQVSGGQGFEVRVAKGLEAGAADSLKQDLVKEGFTGAQTRSSGSGYDVVIGGLPGRQQADAVVAELKKSGYTTSVEVIPAGGATSAANATPVASAETVYRVEVGEFDTPQQAQEASKSLVDEGFVNVDVVEDSGRQLVMLGTFKNESDAKALLGDVSKAGFSLAKVVSRERLSGSAGSKANSADLSTLSATEQAQTREALAMADKVASGQASADEVKKLREQIQQLTENQKAILNQTENRRSSEQSQVQKVFPLYREFDKALRSGDFDQAEKLLAQVEQISPDDIFLPGKRKVLEERRAGGGTEATPVVATAPAAGASQPAPPAPPATPAPSTSDNGMNKNLIYGGAGLAALLILLFAISKLFGKGKAAPAASPTPAAGSSFGMGNSIDPLADNNYTSSLSSGTDTLPTSSLGSSLGAASGLAGVGAVGLAGFHEEENEAPAPEPAKPAPAPAPEPESDTVSLDDLGFTSAASAPAPPPPAAEQESVSIDFNEPAPAKGAMENDLEALLRNTVAADSVAPAAEPEPTPAASGPETVFEQSFANYSEGSTPGEWRGEYDYAMLSVVDVNEPAHGQCLMFNKMEGIGSATYHLTFPEARGIVTAEFDIRCDQKNKFLLGVYLEKDEDFKQSIHTIVHQLDPSAPASLRVQGEAVPYEMGNWVRVRYEVNLNDGVVNAWLDDNQVVNNQALANVPEYLNTLSIRDNLATTGMLYLDNIRITQA